MARSPHQGQRIFVHGHDAGKRQCQKIAGDLTNLAMLDFDAAAIAGPLIRRGQMTTGTIVFIGSSRLGPT